MKTMWDKLRKWIIKKLGGHVGPLKPPAIAYTRIDTVDIRAIAEFPCFEAERVDTDNEARRILAEKIVTVLLDDDLLQIVKTFDEKNMTVIYKGRVKVCDMRGLGYAEN